MGVVEHRDRTSFEVRLECERSVVSVVRQFIERLFGGALRDDEAAARVALAVHELLENCIKYSRTSNGTVALEVRERAGVVTAATENEATEEGIESLRSRFAAMAAAESPASYYAACIRVAAQQKDGSGLGLARIAAEADMQLTLEITGDRVRIQARTREAQASF